jgi:hypothetical protein
LLNGASRKDLFGDCPGKWLIAVKMSAWRGGH